MSKVKHSIAKILEKGGWINKVEVISMPSQKNEKNSFDYLKLDLKYDSNGASVINFLKRVSKPGLRIYVPSGKMPRVLNNFGIAIISTSNGLMTNKEARKQKIGGEVICEIY
jgi:small subunit ribosomal protein S8